jgi:DNA-binding NtrC family response regulator
MPENNVQILGNVLVVEDDSDCGSMVVSALAEEGYGVRLSRNRNEAVACLRRYLYEYIVLDLRMSGMTLADFLAAVSLSVAKSAHVILITAESQVSSEAKRYGIKNWLGKPFTPEQLLQLMAALRVFKPPESSAKILDCFTSTARPPRRPADTW